MEVQPYATEEASLHLFVAHGIIRLIQLDFLLLAAAVPSESHGTEIRWNLKELCSQLQYSLMV